MHCAHGCPPTATRTLPAKGMPTGGRRQPTQAPGTTWPWLTCNCGRCDLSASDFFRATAAPCQALLGSQWITQTHCALVRPRCSKRPGFAVDHPDPLRTSQTPQQQATMLLLVACSRRRLPAQANSNQKPPRARKQVALLLGPGGPLRPGKACRPRVSGCGRPRRTASGGATPYGSCRIGT